MSRKSGVALVPVLLCLASAWTHAQDPGAGEKAVAAKIVRLKQTGRDKFEAELQGLPADALVEKFRIRMDWFPGFESDFSLELEDLKAEGFKFQLVVGTKADEKFELPSVNRDRTMEGDTGYIEDTLKDRPVPRKWTVIQQPSKEYVARMWLEVHFTTADTKKLGKPDLVLEDLNRDSGSASMSVELTAGVGKDGQGWILLPRGRFRVTRRNADGSVGGEVGSPGKTTFEHLEVGRPCKLKFKVRNLGLVDAQEPVVEIYLQHFSTGKRTPVYEGKCKTVPRREENDVEVECKVPDLKDSGYFYLVVNVKPKEGDLDPATNILSRVVKFEK